MLKKIISYTKKYGLLNLTRKIRSKIIPQKSKTRKYYFFSHFLDQTGAPHVLMDILSEFLQHVAPEQITVIAPGADKYYLRKLKEMRVNYLLAASIEQDAKLETLLLGISHNDFVLMNTVEIPPPIRDILFSMAEFNKISALLWYVHEDLPETHFYYKQYVDKVKQLLTANKLKIFTLAQKIQKNYEKFFGAKIYLQPYRFSLDPEYSGYKEADDFSEIKFAVNGSPSEMRKGHTFILAAFMKFYYEFYLKAPEKYRKFQLVFIGIKDDFHSEQVRNIGEQVFPGNFAAYAAVSREKALHLISGCNANICYSYKEALPLNVMESMFMGHFLLRNDCSGLEEQLQPGVNGFLLETNNLQQFSVTLALVLNKTKTSNEQLLEMGRQSQIMVKKYQALSYYQRFTADDLN